MRISESNCRGLGACQKMNFLVKSSQRLIKPSFFAPAGFYSTQRKDPEQVAESILSKFPGDSLAAKASSALITGSVAAWLISNEIYILDGEVFEMACFFGAYAIWYVNGKNSAIEYFNDRKSVLLSSNIKDYEKDSRGCEKGAHGSCQGKD